MVTVVGRGEVFATANPVRTAADVFSYRRNAVPLTTAWTPASVSVTPDSSNRNSEIPVGVVPVTGRICAMPRGVSDCGIGMRREDLAGML